MEVVANLMKQQSDRVENELQKIKDMPKGRRVRVFKILENIKINNQSISGEKDFQKESHLRKW